MKHYLGGEGGGWDRAVHQSIVWRNKTKWVDKSARWIIVLVGQGQMDLCEGGLGKGSTGTKRFLSGIARIT